MELTTLCQADNWNYDWCINNWPRNRCEEVPSYQWADRAGRTNLHLQTMYLQIWLEANKQKISIQLQMSQQIIMQQNNTEIVYKETIF